MMAELTLKSEKIINIFHRIALQKFISFKESYLGHAMFCSAIQLAKRHAATTLEYFGSGSPNWAHSCLTEKPHTGDTE
jgi:hypothetical protein